MGEYLHPIGIDTFVEQNTNGTFNLGKLRQAIVDGRRIDFSIEDGVVHAEVIKFLDGNTSPRSIKTVTTLLREAIDNISKPENQDRLPEIREQLLGTLANTFPDQVQKVREQVVKH